MEQKRLTVRLNDELLTQLDARRGDTSRNEAISQAVRAWCETDNQKQKRYDNSLILMQQLEIKDAQIEMLQKLLDQQQKLALAEAQTRVLSLEPESKSGFFERLKRVFKD